MSCPSGYHKDNRGICVKDADLNPAPPPPPATPPPPQPGPSPSPAPDYPPWQPAPPPPMPPPITINNPPSMSFPPTGGQPITSSTATAAPSPSILSLGNAAQPPLDAINEDTQGNLRVGLGRRTAPSLTSLFGQMARVY